MCCRRTPIHWWRAYVDRIVDAPGAPLAEAGSYGEVWAHLKQAATAHYSDSTVDSFEAWKHATRIQKELAQTHAKYEAVRLVSASPDSGGSIID
jgi:hypothetical protein